MKRVLGILSLLWKIYIAIIFGVTAILFYPLITPFLFKESTKKYSFRLFVVWSWLVRILCFYPIKRMENHPIPEKGPYIIIANHTSYLDIFLMYSIFPKQPFLFLGKSELLSYPLLKTYFKRLNIAVDRKNKQSTREVIRRSNKAIEDGWSLAIFPEGKIPWTPPKMVRFKAGAFNLAKEHNIPIVPMTYTNNHVLFSDPTEILGSARPGLAKIVIHPTFSAEYIQKTETSELMSEATILLEAPIKKAYPEAYKEEN